MSTGDEVEDAIARALAAFDVEETATVVPQSAGLASAASRAAGAAQLLGNVASHAPVRSTMREE